MKRTTEQILEQAYVLIAHLAELRLDLQPHELGPLSQRQKLALAKLFEALQPILPEDLTSLAAEMRKLAAQGLGFEPDPKDRGDIINITELVDEAGLAGSPASLALIRSMQARCEEITGDKFIGALWGPGGESMRAVLTVGGVRVPINPALKTLDHAIKELANQRAQELVKEHVQESLEKVEEVLDHAASQLKERFGGPDAEWEEAMEAEAADPAPAIPQGHHKCLKCDTIYNAEEQKECPKCKHPRPTWYEFNEESES